MQVLKFGGTSLGNAQRILGVVDIIQERCTQSRVGVVLSAVSGATNFLLASITKALEGEDVQLSVSKFSDLHETIIRELAQEKPGFPVEKICSDLTAICDRYRTFLQGIQLLKECPDKIYCDILSLGERMSARLMEVLLLHAGMRVHFIDACDFIKVNLHGASPMVSYRPKGRVQASLATNLFVERYIHGASPRGFMRV